MQSITVPMLKYYFTVTYKDGSCYEQNNEDVSINDQKRSCYYDINQDQVKSFSLHDNENVFLVDIVDGHFEINKIPFYLHDKAKPLTNIRLIYFRQHTHNFNVDRQELEHEIMYQFGWQANDEQGNNIKRIMEIE